MNPRVKSVIAMVLIIFLFLPVSGFSQENKDKNSNASNKEEQQTHWTPLQMSIWNTIQLAHEDRNVYGLKLNLPYGKNRNIYGIDVGLASLSTGDVKGIQVNGLFNGGDKDKDMMGVQIAIAGMNFADKATGIQIAGLGNCASAMTGIQIAGLTNVDVSFSESCIKGVQVAGLTNFALGDARCTQVAGLLNGANQMTGIQLGAVNFGMDFWGIQIGIVNYSDEMKGVQIGLININKNGKLPFFPIINADFSSRWSKYSKEKEELIKEKMQRAIEIEKQKRRHDK